MPDTKLTDAMAAKLVQTSIYLNNENIGTGPKQARFVVVMAVPYGKEDDCENMRDAVDAFQKLISDDDWEERTFQVFDFLTGEIHQYVPENEPRCVDCNEPFDPSGLNGDGWNDQCPACADAIEEDDEDA